MFLVDSAISDVEFEKNWKEWTKTNVLHSKLNKGEVADSFLYRVNIMQIVSIRIWRAWRRIGK